jgi:EpsI family protein
MSGLDRRHLLLSGLVMGAAGVGWWRQPRPARPPWAGRSLAGLVPAGFAGWAGSDNDAQIVMPSAEDAAVYAVYDDQLARVYRRTGMADVLMVITTSLRQSGSLHVHRPEQCYPAAGYRITADRAVSLVSGRPAVARFLTAECEERIEQVLYWIRIGDGFALGAAQEQWLVTHAELGGLIPEGVLVRCSVVTADASAALAQLTGFVGDLHAAAQGPARALLVHG